MTDHLISQAVLKKVDQLRELNIGSTVSLPQLVVVGDQSSGKSSLLESLTGIPFPTNTELCTRYVTQITCRRDSEFRLDVSLIAGGNASAERKKKLEAFRPPSLKPTEFRTRFPEILDQANVHLGIRSDVNDSSTTGAVFTEDVLKIELCSPEEDYLTIIDVPGIFRNTTPGVTTESDIALVRRMVESHICDRRTIILAVLPSNVDVATQEILKLAEKHDPKGERTLGVLTKADLILEQSGKQAVCNLILGKRKPLTLGYYLVCNRGADGDDRTIEEREQMLGEEPWSSLPSDRLGRDALKTRLSKLLDSLTRREFGPLRKDIQRKLQDAERELDNMSMPRETEEQQRLFLSSIAGRFQDLVTGARLGHYSQHNAFEDNADLRLCTNIVNLADDLVQKFAELGHRYKFEQEEEVPPAKEIKDYPPPAVPARTPVVNHPRPTLVPSEFSERSSPVAVTTSSSSVDAELDDDDDISDLLYDLPDFDPPQPDIKDWIAKLHKRYRGAELTSPSPAILESAFKEQSERWDAIARYFVSSCIRAVHAFIRRALSLLCPSPALATDLLVSLIDEIRLRYKASLEKAAYLTRIERSLTPYTLNHLYSAEVIKSRSVRLSGRLRDVGTRAYTEDPNTLTININALHNLAEHEANTSHANDEVHDALKAYYKIAAKRFQDNLYMQAVVHALMSGEETPLGVFSQGWVIGLGREELDRLVGDSETTKEKRRRIEGRKADLQKAMGILRG